MRVTRVRPKPMPIPRTSLESWVFALVWLLFCAAMVAVALFFTPQIGGAYAMDDLTIPADTSVLAPADTTAGNEYAVPMAATVLYPHEKLAEAVKD